jgi:hypothetical protein
MDTQIVNSVRSLMFCLSTQLIRSRVHFFPSAGSTGGHYPVLCQLTIFGKGIERRSVQLDGGRLNQPDGLRLEDAFPALNLEASGICGLEVHLTCPNGRVNLTKSQVVIEMVSPQFSLAYSASPFRPDRRVDDTTASIGGSGDRRPMVGVGIRDAMCSSSLILINANSDTVRPELHHAAGSSDAPLQIGTAAGESVLEFPLDDTIGKHGQNREALWGDARIEKIWSSALAEMEGVACYMLYRDPASKQPVSVYAL